MIHSFAICMLSMHLNQQKKLCKHIFEMKMYAAIVEYLMESGHICLKTDLYNRSVESSLHFFLHCDVASLGWLNLMQWLDRFFLMHHNLFAQWECWNEGERNKNVFFFLREKRNKNVKKGLCLIWHANIWALWKARNDRILRWLVLWRK